MKELIFTGLFFMLCNICHIAYAESSTFGPDHLINTPVTMLDFGIYKMNENLNDIDWQKKIIKKIKKDNNLKEKINNIYTQYLTNSSELISSEVVVDYNDDKKLLIVNFSTVFFPKDSEKYIEIKHDEMKVFIDMFFELLKNSVVSEYHTKGVFDKKPSDNFLSASMLAYTKIKIKFAFHNPLIPRDSQRIKCESLLPEEKVLCEH